MPGLTPLGARMALRQGRRDVSQDLPTTTGYQEPRRPRSTQSSVRCHHLRAAFAPTNIAGPQRMALRELAVADGTRSCSASGSGSFPKSNRAALRESVGDVDGVCADTSKGNEIWQLPAPRGYRKRDTANGIGVRTISGFGHLAASAPWTSTVPQSLALSASRTVYSSNGLAKANIR